MSPTTSVTFENDFKYDAKTGEKVINDKVVLRLRDWNMNLLLWSFALPAIIANALSAVTSFVETSF